MLLAVVVVGCYDPDPPLGVPCSATGECPNDQECDQLTNTCMAPTELLVWRDDTADDFSRPGAVLRDATIERQGFIGPAGYLTGRFKLSGIAADLVADPATTPWDTIAAAPVAGIGFTRDLTFDFGTSIPEGLGLTVGDNITVAVEGELRCDVAGAWRFELDANDRGFVEIAPPGGDFVRVVASANAVMTGTFDVTAPGWYRVRGAFSDAAMNMDFHLRVDPPGSPIRAVHADEMRARVDDLTGYVADGFAFANITDYHASALVEDPLDSSYTSDPFGILLGNATWSMRWSGQVLFDTEGDYTFYVESHHGHRMWIDGKLLADALVNSDQQTTTQAIHLDVGWHDVVVDLTKSTNNTASRLLVRVESGPAWAGQGIPTDHVRPVMGRAVRWASEENGADLAIPDGATATRSLFLELPSNATPLSIQTAFEVDHPVQAQVSLVLDPPAGANQTLIAGGALTGAGGYTGYAAVPSADSGTAWSFIGADSAVDAMTGIISMAAVTIVYAGGVAPFPTSYRYESAVRDLGVVAFGTLRYQLRQATTATVQVRSCDTAEGCASEPWTDVANDAVPTVPARRFAQYAVELTTDGDHPNALDWIELRYSARK